NMNIGSGSLVSGAFSTINWANGPFFLEVEFDPTGGSAYTSMGTSQLLSVPYALYAKTSGSSIPGPAGAIGPTGLQGPIGVTGPAGAGNTLDMAYDEGGAGSGRSITVDAGEVDISTATANGIGLRTTNMNTGVAMIANSTNASNTFSTLQSSSNSSSTNASAIIGNTDGAAWGVTGQASAISAAGAAVYGSNLRTAGGHGVLGIGVNGVVGQTSYQSGFGSYGSNSDVNTPTGNAVGAYGIGYIGVWGDVNPANAYGVYANGDIGAAGVKSFSIDHPKDPENKYLRHFSIESNEVLNMYRGNIAFDLNGEATVTLPHYFEDININFSYHLTPVGGYASLYIKEKISNGKFVIAGGIIGLEVSWTVYAERNDPYLQKYPERRTVEPEKESWNKGKYLRPDLYNQSNAKKIVKPLPKQEQKKLETIK
ncbi:MAG: hypothetical protein HRT73_16745, partial [Flavobacteriales bacterium]|nr:hypothetical protein [Flavobacteriales bacterium]